MNEAKDKKIEILKVQSTSESRWSRLPLGYKILLVLIIITLIFIPILTIPNSN